jgi:nitroreductase
MLTGNDHVQLLRALRSTRRFSASAVPPDVVDDLLEVARCTGSSNNRQPWELVLVRDQDTLRALGTLDGHPGARHLAGAALAIVLLSNGDLTEFDEGRVCERIMLAAAAHGLGASIGTFRAGQFAAVGEILGVPADRPPRIAVSVGYPADERAHLVSVERDIDTRLPLATMPLGRKALTEILHLERYGQRDGRESHRG